MVKRFIPKAAVVSSAFKKGNSIDVKDKIRRFNAGDYSAVT